MMFCSRNEPGTAERLRCLLFVRSIGVGRIACLTAIPPENARPSPLPSNLATNHLGEEFHMLDKTSTRHSYRPDAQRAAMAFALVDSEVFC